MEGVCTLLGEPTDWDSARRVLSDTAFVRKLLDYDRDAVPIGAAEKLAALLRLDGFEPSAVGRYGIGGRVGGGSK